LKYQFGRIREKTVVPVLIFWSLLHGFFFRKNIFSSALFQGDWLPRLRTAQYGSTRNDIIFPAVGGVYCGENKMLTSFQIEIFLGFFLTAKLRDLESSTIKVDAWICGIC
jgi:hypothetical protein